MNIPLLVGGAGAALLFASPGKLRRAGVPVPAYVTGAQSAAMSALPTVLGVPWSGARTNEFTERFNDLKRGLSALRGFKVVGGRSYTQFTAEDYQTIITAFLAAVRAGVVQGGYRIGSASFGGAQLALGEAALDAVLAADAPKTLSLFGGTISAPSVPFPLTALGSAVLAAELERRRVGVLFLAMDHVRTDDIIYRLCNEMDDAGYLVTGKPPPEPKVADGIAYAASASARAVADGVGSIAGGTAGLVAGALVGSPVFWAAGLAFVAWRVL